jgi:hypothetical protein
VEVQVSQLRVALRVVDEDERGGVEVGLSLEPGLPLDQDVRTVLLGRVGALLLNVRPSRSRTSRSCRPTS